MMLGSIDNLDVQYGMRSKVVCRARSYSLGVGSLLVSSLAIFAAVPMGCSDGRPEGMGDWELTEGDAGDDGSAGKSEDGDDNNDVPDSDDPSNDDGDEEDDAGDEDSENSANVPKFDLGEIPEHELGERPCAIDFLFVVDNSGSMSDEQQNLADSVPEFVKTLTGEIENLDDFHIGVTTTDNYWSNGFGCQFIGGLVTQTFGENSANAICGPYANGLNYMTPADNLDKAFTCAARPGTEGDGNERPMDAMRAALDEDALGTGDCNEGFLRDHALLVVVVITDEEDDRQGGASGSAGNPKDWYEDLIAIKGGDPRKIVVLGLIGTEKPNDCEVLVEPSEEIGETGAQISRRLIEFIEMMDDRGFVGDVCAKNYDPFFEDAISIIDLACDDLPQG